jgi:PLP dependent protein
LAVNIEQYISINDQLAVQKATLVAVSKTKPVSEIQELHALGQRDFGENYVQELVEKQAVLPKDIKWHFIGHLQSNKVKLIAPFVSLIHSVESEKLLKEINKQAAKNNRTIDCLLQVHIAQEETKFGLDVEELDQLISRNNEDPNLLNHVCIKGLMGMASFSSDTTLIEKEFMFLKSLFDKYQFISAKNMNFSILSMGMSGDYSIALKAGSNMVRIGSMLFGARAGKGL